MTTLPLEGIRVVELTTYVAAPICGRMLADLGAEVIKVESPVGDAWRHIRRNLASTPNGTVNAVFEMSNSGKKSVVLNLKNPAEMERFHALVATADIFLTNTRAGSLKKLGIDHDAMRARYPNLIYGFVSGYGELGPDCARPGFDLVAFWSMSGFLADMSCPENKYPVTPPTSAGDITSGMTLLAGILTALRQRDKTGRGDYVSVSLYNTAIWVMGTAIMRAGSLYRVKSNESRKDMYPLATVYRCADNEWFQLAILEEVRYAPVFFRLLGVPELIDDPRFNTEKTRVQHSAELLEIVEPIFLTRPCSEWLALFREQDIVCSQLAHFRDVENSEQAWANGYLERVPFPEQGVSCIIPCSPLRLASLGVAHSKPAPVLGADTAAVLAELDGGPQPASMSET